jgi:hypothetical protein
MSVTCSGKPQQSAYRNPAQWRSQNPSDTLGDDDVMTASAVTYCVAADWSLRGLALEGACLFWLAVSRAAGQATMENLPESGPAEDVVALLNEKVSQRKRQVWNVCCMNCMFWCSIPPACYNVMYKSTFKYGFW